MRIVKKYFPTNREVGSTGPDRGLTKAQRRHHRKIFRHWGIETSPNTSIESNIESNAESSVGSNEWTIPTSRSRAGRRAKSDRRAKSERKHSRIKSSKTLSR